MGNEVATLLRQEDFGLTVNHNHYFNPQNTKTTTHTPNEDNTHTHQVKTTHPTQIKKKKTPTKISPHASNAWQRATARQKNTDVWSSTG